MNKFLITAVLSALSLGAAAAEVDPHDLIDGARSEKDCKAYATTIARNYTQADDFSFGGRPAFRRALAHCQQAVAERESAVKTAQK